MNEWVGGYVCLFFVCVVGVGWNLEEAGLDLDLDLDMDMDIKVMEKIARWRGEILIYCILCVMLRI